ncbi:MAG: glycosyltransferase family 4 protein [Chloroflexi bacterium]|nr:glycosyltransferase family 4 protein [Chloroflexota bacterium]
MRLAFDARTIGDHYPGIGRYAHGLLQALGERVSVALYDPALKETRFGSGGKRVACAGVRSPLAQLQAPLIARSADLYYSPYYLMPYALPCPAVVTLYDATPLKGPGLSTMGRALYKIANRLASGVAKKVIVLSESAREEMAEIGVPRNKMVVCPPGLPDRFRPESARAIAEVTAAYNFPESFWLCFGSARWHKNVQAAVLAAGAEPLVIVEGAVREADLPALYSAARGLIFPSLREGFGLPIIEAMACGAPVACLPAPGVREAAGGAAMMAEDMTTEALAEAVRRLADPAVREAKREAGLEWARRFTWDATVQAIESAL